MLFAHLLLIATAPAAEPGQESVSLRYRFEPGQSLQYEVVNDARLELTHAQQSQTMHHDSRSTKNYEILSVSGDGAAILQLSILHVRMTAEEPGVASYTYDSASEGETPEAFQMVAATVGKPLARIRISPTGNVESVTDTRNGAAIENQLTRSNTHVLVPLPEEEVSVGSVWKEPFEAEVAVDPTNPVMRKSIKMQRTYRLMAIEEGVAVIAWRTAVLTPLNDPQIESQLSQRLLSGELRFDVEAGRVISRTGAGDDTVIGFQGPQTKVHSVIRQSERLAAVDGTAVQ